MPNKWTEEMEQALQDNIFDARRGSPFAQRRVIELQQLKKELGGSND